jgi:hypothetical protein
MYQKVFKKIGGTLLCKALINDKCCVEIGNDSDTD